MNLFRAKPIHHDVYANTGLHRCLTTFDLTFLGIGAIIGAGIFVLSGHAAAEKAGPAIVLSFIIAGFACAFAALAYAELAAMVGGCGSAYGYAYAGIGELIAWIIGWDLILEYGLATSTVAIGWSSYVGSALKTLGLELPLYLLKAPAEGGMVNLPAVLIVLVLAILLAVGVRQSARFNAAIVFIKLTAIGIFIALASVNVTPAHWQPFMPFGWGGVMAGAAYIFFAYIGFDAVSTAAEETVNPQRDLPKGILYSLGICTVIFILVAGLLTGIVSYTSLKTASPVADALSAIGYHWGSAMIAAGAIAGLTTVMLVLFYGLTRVFLAMSRDGLLPPVFASINSNTKTPVTIIIISGILMAVIAGFTPINKVGELVNMGTLAAFVLVCAGVVMLRITKPDVPRPFKVPFNPLLPILGILFCLALMFSLPAITWIGFGIWTVAGLLIYFFYSQFHSNLNQQSSAKL